MISVQNARRMVRACEQITATHEARMIAWDAEPDGLSPLQLATAVVELSAATSELAVMVSRLATEAAS